MMNFLTERQQLGELLEGLPENGVRVLCGDDTPVLEGSSMIVARYSLGERGHGAIGIVGPMRLDYANIIPRIEYFAKSIGLLLEELFEESSALDMR